MSWFLCRSFRNIVKLSNEKTLVNVFNKSLFSTETETEIKQNQAEAPKEPEAVKLNTFAIAKAYQIGNLGWQPTADTHSPLLIDGVQFNKTHIVTIKSSKNNTILSLTDPNGNILFTTSSGTVGFKNSKKSTAVAGQGAGLALCENAKRRGIKNVRVVVKGFGNGRLASIKALQMGKLNIVSITDNTPIPLPFARAPRPPAKRRV